MNKIRTIIIDDNSIVTSSLSEHFKKKEDIEVVNTFTDGESALTYILTYPQSFDLIIMDVLLPRLDGTALLEELKSRDLKKNVIVLSSYKDDKVIKKCMDFNVTHYMLKPVNISSLEQRIYEAFENEEKTLITNSKKRIDLEVSQLLHNLGIPTHIRGYKYLRDSVLIVYSNEKLSFVTKELYPQIAQKYATTPTRVERAIRHAIEVSCIRGDIALIDELFGYSISSDKSRPTNFEFITTIADRFKVDKNFGKNQKLKA